MKLVWWSFFMLDSVRLPSDWPSFVRSAVLRVISLAHLSLIYSRSWCVNSPIERVRLKSRLVKAENDLELFREASRVLRDRLGRIHPMKRPNYSPVERMSILELKAAFGLSKAQAARMFLVEPDTIASWMKRLDEGGESALVQLVEPVNKFPEFVRYLVRGLKVLCPFMGKVKIAQFLARAGLHLGVTTIGRMLKEKEIKPTVNKIVQIEKVKEGRKVVAKYPNHIWNIDLTLVPTLAGFWVPWIPFSKIQIWPFCWWIFVVIDHFSRNIIALELFRKQPKAFQTNAFLTRVINKLGRNPKYIISDKGNQFWCKDYKKWCDDKNIVPRFGAIGKYGSIAVLERFFKSLKNEFTRRISIPLKKSEMKGNLDEYQYWFNNFRPHQGLNGRTPNEVRYELTPVKELPRFETRKKYPLKRFCTGPKIKVRGSPGVRLELLISYHNNNKNLPILELKEA